MKLPAEGVYVKSVKLSEQLGSPIYFKVAPHTRGTSSYFHLFAEQPKTLEHAVDMHSELSRVTTRVCVLSLDGTTYSAQL